MRTVTYQDFITLFRRKWHPGQHVSVIGPTGSGKSTVAHDVELMRKRVVVIATKAKDETLDTYTRFKRREKWPPEYHEQLILFWRKPKRLGDFREQQEAIYHVMQDIYKVGSWTVVFDDLFYVSDTLRLKEAVRMFYTQVRSNNVSIVSNIQRPFWVPLEALSQSTYALLFPTRDERDIKRVAEGLGYNWKELKAAVAQLKEYEFLLLETGKDPIHVQRRAA